jgi:hypothetical protein
MLPKFNISEDWNTQDVTIYFEDKVSNSLHEYVCDTLSKVVSELPADNRTVYHLEDVIKSIFSTVAVNKQLRKTNGYWTIIGR